MPHLLTGKEKNEIWADIQQKLVEIVEEVCNVVSDSDADDEEVIEDELSISSPRPSSKGAAMFFNRSLGHHCIVC
jgi:hypothetical protein